MGVAAGVILTLNEGANCVKGCCYGVWTSAACITLTSFMFGLGSINDANRLFSRTSLAECVSILWVLSLFSSYRMKSPWVIPPAAPAIYQRWAKAQTNGEKVEGEDRRKIKNLTEWCMASVHLRAQRWDGRALSCSSRSLSQSPLWSVSLEPELLWRGSSPLRPFTAPSRPPSASDRHYAVVLLFSWAS